MSNSAPSEPTIVETTDERSGIVTESSTSEPTPSSEEQGTRLPTSLVVIVGIIGAVAVVALVFALLAYFKADPDTSASGSTAAPTTAGSGGTFRDSSIPVGVPTIVTEADLRAFGARYQPIYWAGPDDATQYELTATEDGSVFIRYLPEAIAVGDAGEFLTVATYVVVDGYQLLADQATTDGVTAVNSESGAIVVTYDNDDNRAYFAFDGSDFQVEVFDPDAGVANQLVSDGSLIVLQ